MLFELRVVVKDHAKQFNFSNVMLCLFWFGSHQHISDCETTLLKISIRRDSYPFIFYISVGRFVVRIASKHQELP